MGSSIAPHISSFCFPSCQAAARGIIWEYWNRLQKCRICSWESLIIHVLICKLENTKYKRPPSHATWWSANKVIVLFFCLEKSPEFLFYLSCHSWPVTAHTGTDSWCCDSFLLYVLSSNTQRVFPEGIGGNNTRETIQHGWIHRVRHDHQAYYLYFCEGNHLCPFSKEIWPSML